MIVKRVYVWIFDRFNQNQINLNLQAIDLHTQFLLISNILSAYLRGTTN